MTLSSIGDLPLFKRRAPAYEELEALLDLLPYPTLIAEGRSGRIVFVNAHAIQLTAYTRAEFLELNLKTVLPHIVLEPSNRDGAATETRLVKRNSNTINVRVKTAPLGGPDGWIALNLIPEAMVRTTERLEEAANHRREALRALTTAVSQEDDEVSLRQTLTACKSLTQSDYVCLYYAGEGKDLKLKFAEGANFQFPAALIPADLPSLHNTKTWQSGREIENTIDKAAHASKLTFVSSAPLKNHSDILGVIVAAGEGGPPSPDFMLSLELCAAMAANVLINSQDISRLRAHVSNLSEKIAKTSVIQDHARDAILILGTDRKVLEINPSAEEILGYPSEEIIGKSADDILIGERSLAPEIGEATRNQGFVEAGDRKLHRRDGSEFLASVRIASITKGSKTTQLMILLNDLSEREAMHVRGQQLQQRAWLGEVTAIFAHEVRNPINNMSTGLQLMQLNLAENDPLQEQVRRLQEDCDRLDHRMNSVLSFSRNMDQQLEPIDIGEFCHLQLDRWRAKMSRRKIKDHLQVAEKSPLVLGDRRALDQVFTNLITNAIQAMEQQGEGVLAIKIGPDQDDPDMVNIRVSDSGPGIPKDLRSRVFDPFFTTKEDEGTGLGLAITRRIILSHKGEIDFESFPGGTLFKIKLPAAAEPAEATDQ
jgi:PAS domain S-box-containing protein